VVRKVEKIVDRKEKEAFVSSLRSALENAGLIVVSHQSGLTVAEATQLRTMMRQAGASFKVAKNTLARLAMKGLPCEAIAEKLSGPTAISYSKDPVAAAKVLAKFSKANEKLVIVAGVLGNELLAADAIHQLAKLPSLDELRGTIIGLIQAPATKIAGVVQAVPSQLARVVAAYSKKV
jgi:large subunit ribosomal protein L10